ncbi:31 kDa ribonucleoprotein, chloroplastic [Malania oleifera]|uniref:31 kDa ribonucleoprotein, chloroplastic n=1 Tax=Malania oleifera TaxID=397392 RepID=UPI0025ADEB36|nr:31 kDa ribonucleoprotein, chloroplastic [Malania oleifera]
MAALEAAASVFSILASTPSSSSTFFPLSYKFLPVKLHVSASTPSLSLKYPLSPFLLPPNSSPARRPSCELCCAVQEVTLEQVPEQTQELNQKKKLFVANLPWSFSVADVKNLFSECGTVRDVEIIKHKDGRSRGFAFVTMASGEETQAVVDKFNSYELSGRTLKVEFAKRFRKPSPSPASPPTREIRYKLYVSNLSWTVRSGHLKEFFSANFSPLSTKVIFDNPSGGSGGYGFVSFATKEEAEAAISALDGKELMGRPIRLQFSHKNIDESRDEKEVGDICEGQPEKSD